MSADTITETERRTWLLELLGPEDYARVRGVLDAPMSAETAARVDTFLDDLERMEAAHAANLERILADALEATR